MVAAVTDEEPIGHFKVPRDQRDKLCEESIVKSLENRGLVLLSIGSDGGYPACRNGWTLNSYNTNPVPLCVGHNTGLLLWLFLSLRGSYVFISGYKKASSIACGFGECACMLVLQSLGDRDTYVSATRNGSHEKTSRVACSLAIMLHFAYTYLVYKSSVLHTDLLYL